MATCNPTDLVADAECFACLSKQQLQAVIAQLLCDINAGGGGGGGSQTPWLQNINGGGFNLSNVGLINGIKIYRAILTQSSTAAPVATVMENSLGGTLVWTRSVQGAYDATLSGVFTANKSFLMAPPLSNVDPGAIPPVFSFTRTSANVVRLTTSDGTDLVDDMLLANPVEILVYP